MTTDETVLNAAYKIAEEQSLNDVTSPKIAVATNLSRPTIFYYFKTIDALREKVIEKAVTEENVKILKHLVVAGHPAVRNISQALRKKIVNALF